MKNKKNEKEGRVGGKPESRGGGYELRVYAPLIDRTPVYAPVYARN